MSEHEEQVARVIGQALHDEYHDNADPYEDSPLRFGVAFPDGSMVDVVIGRLVVPVAESAPHDAEMPDWVRDALRANFTEWFPCEGDPDG